MFCVCKCTQLSIWLYVYVLCSDSYAYAFYAASLISGSSVEKIHRLIEDAAAQADEVDEKYLQVV